MLTGRKLRAGTPLAMTGPGPRAAGRRPRAAAAVALAAVTALIVVAGAPPARADSVRDAEEWVLSAVNAPAAWPVSRGAGVTVAVIDSGVNGGVSDLVGSVRNGPDLTGVHTPSSNPYWGMHGTWMASLIAGHGHDGGSSGITGIAPMSTVLSIRVITDKLDPGYAAYQRQSLSKGQDELARAIRYAVRHGVAVISMSLGYGAQSLAVRSALQDAYAHKVVVVASSGNSGIKAKDAGSSSAPYSFPANYPGVLSVAAVGQDRRPAAFSSDNISVGAAAPGINVPAQGRDGQYWLVSGTSPACAITAGVAALIKGKYPSLSDAQVIDAITSSTWRRPAGGYDQQVGFGTVDALAALTAAGHLAAQRQSTDSAALTRHFGGASAGPPAPVQPRGVLDLVLFCLLGLACLIVIGATATGLVVLRRPAAHAGPPPSQPDPLPGPLDPPSHPDLPASPPDPRAAPVLAPGWGLLTRDEDDLGDGRYLAVEIAPDQPAPESRAGPGWFPWQDPPAGRPPAAPDRSAAPGAGE